MDEFYSLQLGKTYRGGNMTLGEAFTIRFNSILKSKRITLHKFVKKSCIPRSTLVNVLKGNTKNPSLALVYQVAAGFEMTALDFLDDPIFNRYDIEY